MNNTSMSGHLHKRLLYKSLLPTKNPPGRNRLKKALLLCLAPLVMASCATRIRIPAELEPERLLPAGAVAYLRINPVMADELIFPYIEPYGITLAADMLERTESVVLAVMPPFGIPGGQASKPVVYGVVSGKFPTRSIALKLNTDRHWAKEGHSWINKEDGFRLALTSRGQILVGTAPLDAITSGGYDKPHPVPEFWSTAWNNDLAMYLPDPFSFLDNKLPVDASGLPLEAMLISTRRMDDQYVLFLGFEFAMERSAVVFTPLCRLFVYALAKSLWPQQASEILSPVTWSTQGSTVEASGLRLDALQLAGLLALPFGETLQARIGQMGGSK